MHLYSQDFFGISGIFLEFWDSNCILRICFEFLGFQGFFRIFKDWQSRRSAVSSLKKADLKSQRNPENSKKIPEILKKSRNPKKILKIRNPPFPPCRRRNFSLLCLAGEITKVAKKVLMIIISRSFSFFFH